MFRIIRTRLRRRPAPGTALAFVALVVAFGGVAYASIPAADGTIKGCYATTNGLLLGIPHSKGDTRIVDSGEACRSYEQTIAWNQAGAPGTPGTNGTNGVSGYEIVTGSHTGVAKALCPAGKRAVGGGGFVTFGAFERSFPMEGPVEYGWLLDSTDANAGVTAYAVCVNAP
jgi:hypothetical protein